jgi:hypothetical protein
VDTSFLSCRSFSFLRQHFSYISVGLWSSLFGPRGRWEKSKLDQRVTRANNPRRAYSCDFDFFRKSAKIWTEITFISYFLYLLSKLLYRGIPYFFRCQPRLPLLLQSNISYVFPTNYISSSEYYISGRRSSG